MKKFTVVALLALLVAVIAPLWATLAAFQFGLMTGAVALICAGVYVANGSILKNALKITLGFLAGNFWAWFVMLTLGKFGMTPLSFFCTLFVYVIVAVFISMYLDTVFDLSSWLAGWAITLTLLGPVHPGEYGKWLLHIGIAMVAGVWLIGVLITQAHGFLLKKISKK